MSSSSIGLSVNMSTTRTEKPSALELVAASSACATTVPCVKIVASVPWRAMMPLPMRMSCSPGS